MFIYTALSCEAKPLIAHFRLKKEIRPHPFSVYGNGKLCLVVTGVGKNAMAAGVAYSQAYYGKIENPVLINLGIAGHRTATISTPFMVHKITDADTGKNYYPVPAYSLPCASAPIVTASRPQLNYTHGSLCDMEASAFYETAIRFSTGELIQCLKFVSDNQATPADRLDDRQVMVLVERNLDVLDSLMAELEGLAQRIAVTGECEDCDRLIRQYRFTVSQQNQLKSLLSRWRVLTDNEALEVDGIDLKSGREVLHWLEQQVNAVGVRL